MDLVAPWSANQPVAPSFKRTANVLRLLDTAVQLNDISLQCAWFGDEIIDLQLASLHLHYRKVGLSAYLVLLRYFLVVFAST